jgi:phosphoribosylanthranilate isomerase
MTPPLYAPGRTAIKFCGITDSRGAALARAAGADAVGVILAPSERRVPLSRALALAADDDRPPTIVAVVGSDLSAVADLRAAGFVLQFCSPIDAANANRLAGGAPYLRVVHLAAHESSTVDESFAGGETPLFDVAEADRLGGTGRMFDWKRVAQCASRYPVVVAGGLNSSNVGACIRCVRPAAVDVRSGIEHRGRKSIAKMHAFVDAVREADRDRYAA